MSFINKIYKFDKVFINRGWSALQKSDATIRRFTSVNGNSRLVNGLLNPKICDNKFLTKITSTRQLQMKARTYHATELLYVRTQVLGNSENYVNSTMVSLPDKAMTISNAQDIIDKKWSHMCVPEILENFEHLSYYAKENDESLADPKYSEILNVIAKKMPDFRDTDIHFLLKCLEFWQLNVKEPVCKEFFEAIDKECLARRQYWSVDEILLVNDLFFNIRVNRYIDFTWRTLNKLGHKPSVLTAPQLVQFAFFLKVNREIRATLYNTEYCFEQYFDKFTIDELGVFAMAFDKYNTTVKSKYFLMKIMEKLTNEIDSVSDITLIALLRILRWINSPDYVETAEKLMVALDAQIDKREAKNLVHIAFWFKDIRCKRRATVDKILNRLEKEIPNLNIKGIQKILYALLTLNYDQKETPLFSLAIDELLKPERAEEIAIHKRPFVEINLSCLSANFYSEEALKRVLDPEFTKQIFDVEEKLLPEYLVLDYLIEIEHPEYTGPRLPKEKIELLLKRHGSLSNYLKRTNRKIITKWYTLQNVVSACQQLCGSETAIHEDVLLPHLALTDLVLCYDPEIKKFISPNEKLSKIPNGEIKFAPKDGKEWYAVVIAPSLVFTNDTSEPTGLLNMRLRQLERIGYKTIVVPMKKWGEARTDSERLELMRELIPALTRSE